MVQMLNTRRVLDAEARKIFERKIELATEINNAAHRGDTTRDMHDEFDALNAQTELLQRLDAALVRDEATTRQLTWEEAR